MPWHASVGSVGAKTKGVGFTNVKSFVCERFGPSAWDDMVARLPPSDQVELGSIVSVGWYPLASYARLINELERAHGTGDLSLVQQLGAFEAEQDLTTIHRIFLRMANPAFILEQMGNYWKRFHDSGEWEIARVTDNQARAVLRGWGHVDAALCRELTGYMHRSFELAGAKQVRLEHPRCRANGHRDCEFEGWWR
jgi:hypothetical protein